MAKNNDKNKNKDEEKKRLNFKSVGRKLNRFTHGNIGGIAKIVVICLIVANIFSFYVFNGQYVTFTSFLQMLSDAPQISFGLNVQEWVINLPDWLNWLEVLINPLTRLLGLFAMLAEMGLNLITFLGYFIGWFFGVV